MHIFFCLSFCLPVCLVSSPIHKRCGLHGEPIGFSFSASFCIVACIYMVLWLIRCLFCYDEPAASLGFSVTFLNGCANAAFFSLLRLSSRAQSCNGSN